MLTRLDNVRSLGGGKAIARCPAHDDRTPSLSISEAENGNVLIRCFAGCPVESVVAAIGLHMSDLFVDSPRTKPISPAMARKKRAVIGLSLRRTERLSHVCSMLRDLDTQIEVHSRLLAHYEDGQLRHDPKIKEQAWDFLSFAYKWRTEFEHEFEVLNGTNAKAHLELWRTHAKS